MRRTLTVCPAGGVAVAVTNAELPGPGVGGVTVSVTTTGFCGCVGESLPQPSAKLARTKASRKRETRMANERRRRRQAARNVDAPARTIWRATSSAQGTLGRRCAGILSQGNDDAAGALVSESAE